MTPDQLVKEIKLATDYQVNKRLLKEKITADLHMTFNNGMFMLTPALLAFVSTWPDPVLYLEDVYGNPIEINRDEWLKQAQSQYHMVMNSWHIQHEELKRTRKI